MKYTLKMPIQNGSETITEFNLREFIKAKDFRGLPDGDLDRALELIARLAAQPTHVVDELRDDDVDALGELVSGFRKGGRKTGTTP